MIKIFNLDDLVRIVKKNLYGLLMENIIKGTIKDVQILFCSLIFILNTFYGFLFPSFDEVE